MDSLIRLLVRHRNALLVAVLAVTALAGYLASTLKLYDDPNQWPPSSDPAVELNNRIQSEFGGSNLVTIMISRSDGGSIVAADSLAKVKRITDRLMEVHGVIPYAVRSLSTINARYLHGTAEVLDASILFEDPNRAPETPAELERVLFGIRNNAALGKLLVSNDETATIIQADFRTSLAGLREGLELPTTDPIAIYKEVNEIIGGERDASHHVTAAGTPILIGWVNSDGLPYILFALAIVITGIAVVLAFGFRSEIGILPPLLVGIIASIWAFGFQRLFAGEILSSASGFLAPFIIVAVAASHSVIFVKRLLADELIAGTSLDDALTATLGHMAKPMVMALITDLVAFCVLAVVPFDNVRVLGQITAAGLVAVLVLIPTFLVGFLGLMPASRLARAAEIAQSSRSEGTGLVYRATALFVRPLVYNRTLQIVTLTIAVLTLVLSLTFWVRIPIGEPGSLINRLLNVKIEIGQDNTYAVHNYLTRSWEDNELYQQEMEIKKRFGAVYTMTMLAKGPEEGSVKTPEALRALDGLAAHLEQMDEVPAVLGLPFYVKIMNRFMNEDRDEEFRIPVGERAQMAVNEALYFLTGGQPGAFDFVVDPTYSRSSMVALVTDTSPATVSKVLEAANSYLDREWDPAAVGGVEVELAGGSVGIADAFNRGTARWLVLATVLSAVASFIAAAFMLRSLVGPLMLMFPLLGGTILWAVVLYAIGIEFNSNVSAALAIASGVGIDAEVYLLFRFREEYPKHGDFQKALFDAFTLVREPLMFSFFSLFAGCLAVVIVPLYVGYVGFAMALVLLTTFVFSFFVAPAMWAVAKPKFLTRGLRVEGAGAPATSAAGAGSMGTWKAASRRS